MIFLRSLPLAVLALLPAAAAGHFCDSPPDARPESVPAAGLPQDEHGRERYDAGWSLWLDNDALAVTDTDQDYTGGLAFTLAGRRAQEWWFSMDPALGAINRLLRSEARDVCHEGFTIHSLQFGLLSFAPIHLSAHEPVPDDRPYASLIFVSNGRLHVPDAEDHAVYQTSLSVGVLGLNLAKGMHRGLHRVIDAETPNGWDNQISDGGEPTFRYSWSRQALWRSSLLTELPAWEVKHSLEATAGYITEVNVGLSTRWGLINTPWWSFTPDRAEYVVQAAPVVSPMAHRPGVQELYLWAGAKLRLRLYSAFLQGQFRDSAVTYDFDDLYPVIGEAWLGLTKQFGPSYRLSWVVRYQTSEINSGPSDRELMWGTVLLSRDL